MYPNIFRVLCMYGPTTSCVKSMNILAILMCECTQTYSKYSACMGPLLPVSNPQISLPSWCVHAPKHTQSTLHVWAHYLGTMGNGHSWTTRIVLDLTQEVVGPYMQSTLSMFWCMHTAGWQGYLCFCANLAILHVLVAVVRDEKTCRIEHFFGHPRFCVSGDTVKSNRFRSVGLALPPWNTPPIKILFFWHVQTPVFKPFSRPLETYEIHPCKHITYKVVGYLFIFWDSLRAANSFCLWKIFLGKLVKTF